MRSRKTGTPSPTARLLLVLALLAWTAPAAAADDPSQSYYSALAVRPDGCRSGTFWTIQDSGIGEKSLLEVRLEAAGWRLLDRHPIEGGPADPESLAWSQAQGLWLVGSEGPTQVGAYVPAGGGGERLEYRELDDFAVDLPSGADEEDDPGSTNLGVEGLCVAGDHALAASETAFVLDGQRYAPLKVYAVEAGSALRPLGTHFLYLGPQRSTVRISALSCRAGRDGRVEALALRRNSRSGRYETDVVQFDLDPSGGGAIYGTPRDPDPPGSDRRLNWEGIESCEAGWYLLADNDGRGPTYAALGATDGTRPPRWTLLAPAPVEQAPVTAAEGGAASGQHETAAPDSPPPPVDKAACSGKPGAASCAKMVEAEKKKETQLNVSVGVTFHGDRTNREAVGAADSAESLTRRVSDLGLQFAITTGYFPEELRVRAKTKFRNQDGTTTEDVSTALVQYDYHPRHDLQLFTFAERFADNFLAVDQRWEVGGGVSYEWNVRDRKTKDRRIKDPAAESGEHALLHPTEVGLTCKRPGGKKRGWYHVTRSGYLALEAWAAEYQAAKDKLEKLQESRRELCQACGDRDSRRQFERGKEDEVRNLEQLYEQTEPNERATAADATEECAACTDGRDKKLLEFYDNGIKQAKTALETIRRDFCGRHARSLEKRYAVVQPALSAAVFLESEKATLKECQNAVRVQGASGGTGSDCSLEELAEETLPGDQRIRLSIRPSIRVRPHNALSVTARYFWKRALDSPRKDEMGRRDLREDFRLELELAASSKISLTWTADWHSDDVPPSTVLADGQTLQAFDSHWAYDMGVKVTF